MVGAHFKGENYLCAFMCVSCSVVSQSLRPHGPPSGSSVHGILQARILEWVVISSSRGSSQPRGQTWVSCIRGRFFTIWAHIKPRSQKLVTAYTMRRTLSYSMTAETGRQSIIFFDLSWEDVYWMIQIVAILPYLWMMGKVPWILIWGLQTNFGE